MTLRSEFQTIMWKEWLELRQGARGGRSGLTYQVLSVVAGGALIGVGWRDMLLRSHLTTFVLGIAAAGSVLPFVGDSVAGERERHTLESLLATPVRASAIIGGKIATLVLYAWASTILFLAVAIVASRVAGGFFPSPNASVLASALVVPPLIALAFGACGMLLSLRAQSVRGAQQQLGMLLSAFMIVPLLLARALPASSKGALYRSLGDASAWELIALGIVAVLCVDALLLVIVRLRFTRHQLASLLT